MDAEKVPHLIPLGLAERMEPISLDLRKVLAGRLLIQASSGGGKSWAVRRILEKTNGLIQQIIIDPDGEFVELARASDIPIAKLSYLTADATAALAERVRRHRTSLLIDATDIGTDDFAERIASFLGSLVDQPREHWHPLLLVVDEAHLVAPQGASRSADQDAKRSAVAALIDVMARGRKRGIGTILATQRFAKLAQSVAAEAVNVMIGQNMLMTDLIRAGKLLGWTAEKAQVLTDLTPGHFYAFGPALANYPKKVLVGTVRSTHMGATPDLTLPPDLDAEEATKLLELDAIQSAEPVSPTYGAPVSATPKSSDRLHRFAMLPESITALRVLRALADVSPNAIERDDVSRHLVVDREEIDRALSVLAAEKMIETRIVGSEHLIRLSADMRRMNNVVPIARLAS